MAQAGLSISRRATFGLAAVPLIGAADPVLALQSQRAAILERIEATDADDSATIDRLCDLNDTLALRMAKHPTLSRAGAAAKLRVVAETFSGDLASGSDKALFDQAFAWIASA
jgi:hypothetical protein